MGAGGAKVTRRVSKGKGAFRPLRIVVVTQYFQPEGGAGAARVGYLAEYLRRQGHEVSVIAPLPNYPKGEIHPDYRGRVRVKERL